MKRCLLVVALLLTAMAAAASASTPDGPIDGRLKYLAGSYALIGKHPDSEKTYAGRITVLPHEQGLKITRAINGRSIQARGELSTATPDRISVLRVSFKEHGKLHEETCLISSDLDNYPRVSCYLQNKFTKKVGLEAWFADHGQLRRP